MDVYRTPAAALDQLVVGSLQPLSNFTGLARRALGNLAATLRERGPPSLRVRKTVQVRARIGRGFLPVAPSWARGGVP